MTQQDRPYFPSKSEILDFIKDNPTASGKREIARAFRLQGDAKIVLRNLLREMRNEGLLAKDTKGRLGEAGRLPSVAIIEVTGLDDDGELLARPANWQEESPPPLIRLVAQSAKPGQSPGVGDRVLVRLERHSQKEYLARVIRRLEANRQRVIGLYVKTDKGGRLRPSEKRIRNEFHLHADNAGPAKPGDLVLAELVPGRKNNRLGLKDVKVVERLGSFEDPNAISLIALHEHSIPNQFPKAAIEEAEAAGPAPESGREDLRDLDLVTIDGADARDFDDAVYAIADEDPKNPGGWNVLVAIADVAHYVRPGSMLDREAATRGNSVYFPDRVVPMLPEALSNGWCSLKPQEDRSCLAAWMTFDAKGKKLRHRFLRGLMRSSERLTYEAAQEAYDADGGLRSPALDERVTALYGAYQSLQIARESRGTLELDLPERQIIMSESGEVLDIKSRERLDSHRLIEEFMIAANVAAAEELERLRQPCMYRIHEPPDPQKIEALGEVLKSFDLKLSRGQVMRPKLLNSILRQVAKHPEASIVHQMVLRAQSQAVYAPENLGHFGLALSKYAHFTSPIRRYSDLLVHRALIAGLGLSGGALTAESAAAFSEIATHISSTERRAAAAERDTIDRLTAVYLSGAVGSVVTGQVTSVTRFGLFLRLEPSGGDGLLPISDLPEDYYRLDSAGRHLTGDRWGQRFSMGEKLQVRILHADPISGALRLGLLDKEDRPLYGDTGKGSAALARALNSPRTAAAPRRKTRKSEPGRSKKAKIRRKGR